ncbi:MAG: MCE family protein [Armatimonadetes bacterium]|nr:MCE family protein [Armatimonadota bacterium]NIM23103.1 MCE family protein [Armatimonadota bacterium]NIM66971.1 MCE family protein [Armatimonadota bacterium]NIM75505.1 MCE family protein [Armatimonadota bacterium]NIN05160.1 MCE family protein [Armatimonadota bacterium]
MSRLSEAKVGAIVISALVVLVLLSYFFLGPVRARGVWPLEIIFEDARGLIGGEPVRMAGVQIGVVEEVSLSANGKASVRVLIKDHVHLYENYVFTVSSGALVPERFVDVQSVSPVEAAKELTPGAVVEGLERPGIPEIMNAAHSMMTRLEQTAASVHSVVSNPAVEKSVEQLEISTREAAKMIKNLESLVAEARPHLAETARHIAVAGEETQKAASYLSARIRQSSAPDEIEAAAVAAKEAAENARETATSMKALLSDQTWQDDFRTSLANFREISENLREASEDVKEGTPKIKSIIERADSLMTDASQWSDRLKPPEVETGFDFLNSSRADRSFTDARFDLSFAGRKKSFLRLGVADIGELNQVNFQAGRRLGNNNLRYGLVRSKIGAGADLSLGQGGRLSLDFFDPNRLRADFTMEYPLGGEDGWGLIFGMRDAFGEDWGFVGGRLGE